MRSVIIAYPSEKLAIQLKKVLTAYGIKVAAICAKGSSVLNLAGTLGEGIVVCPLLLPDMPAYHLAEALPLSFDIVALSKGAGPSGLCSTLTVLTLPLDREEFLALVCRLCTQNNTAASARRPRSTAERAQLERAKALLMAQKGMSESQAHRYLQRLAMSNGQTLCAAAGQIINSAS